MTTIIFQHRNEVVSLFLVVVREGGEAAPQKYLPGALSLAPLEDLEGAVSVHSEEGGLSVTGK